MQDFYLERVTHTCLAREKRRILTPRKAYHQAGKERDELKKANNGGVEENNGRDESGSGEAGREGAC